MEEDYMEMEKSVVDLHIYPRVQTALAEIHIFLLNTIMTSQVYILFPKKHFISSKIYI